jgi:hypothetical protein
MSKETGQSDNDKNNAGVTSGFGMREMAVIVVGLFVILAFLIPSTDNSAIDLKAVVAGAEIDDPNFVQALKFSSSCSVFFGDNGSCISNALDALEDGDFKGLDKALVKSYLLKIEGIDTGESLDN